MNIYSNFQSDNQMPMNISLTEISCTRYNSGCCIKITENVSIFYVHKECHIQYLSLTTKPRQDYLVSLYIIVLFCRFYHKRPMQPHGCKLSVLLTFSYVKEKLVILPA